MSQGCVDRRAGAASCGRIFVNSVGAIGIQLTMQQIRKMLRECSRPCFFGSWFLAGKCSLCTDCVTLVSGRDEEH